MVALVQRVSEAAVDVDDTTVGAINDGLLILLGVHEADTEAESEWCAAKCAHLRVFPDADGKMDDSLLDTGGTRWWCRSLRSTGTSRAGTGPRSTKRPHRAAPNDSMTTSSMRSKVT